MNDSPARLSGGVAIVTGAARGQGRAHCLRLAREGADVFAIDIARDDAKVSYELGSVEALEETVRLAQAEGVRASSARADVAKFEEVEAAVQAACEELGPPSIVVSNAGIFSSGLSWELTEPAWDRMMDVVLKGPWNVARACIPRMIAADRGGSIINIGSTAAVKGVPRMAHYVAAKHGLLGLTRTMARELGRYRIRTNMIIVTTTNTVMAQNDEVRGLFTRGEGLTDEEWESMNTKMHVLPTPWIEPEDVSAVVAFLASDEARFVTGAAWAVDAGYTIK